MGQVDEGIDRSHHHADAHDSSVKFLSASLVHSPSDQRLPEVLIIHWHGICSKNSFWLKPGWVSQLCNFLDAFQNGRDNVMRMNLIAFQRTALMPIMRQR